MAEPSSYLDRLDPVVAPRDTPAVLGTELPGGCQRCTDLYRRLEAFDDLAADLDTALAAVRG